MFHTQLLQTAVVYLTQFHFLIVVSKIWQLNYVYILVLKWFHEKMYTPHFQSLKILYGYLQTTFLPLWTVLKKSDRLDKQCGGDAVHVNKHIHAERMHDLEIRGLESV